MNRFLDTVSGARTAAEVFSAFLDCARGIVAVERLTAGLVTGARAGGVDIVYSSPWEVDAVAEGLSVVVGGTVIGRAMGRGVIEVIGDLREDADGGGSEWLGLLAAAGQGSAVIVPLRCGGEATGAAVLSHRQRGAFAAEHAEKLAPLAPVLALAADRARLAGEVERRGRAGEETEALHARFVDRLQEEVGRRTAELNASRERYRGLLRIAAAANTRLDFEELLGRVAGELRGLFRFDRASLVVAAEDGTAEYHVVDAERGRASVGARRRPDPGSAAAVAMRDRRPVVAADLLERAAHAEDDIIAQEGFRSYVVVPLVARGAAIGAFGLASRVARAYGDAEAEFLRRIAEQVTIAVANARAFAEAEALRARLQAEAACLRDEIRSDHHFYEIIGKSGALRATLAAVERVAPTDSTVLLRGETGTGKDLFARAVHALSRRRERPFMKVDCAGLAESLIESELFGHERGAFTGAVQRRPGRLELADGGTVFLDEIGNLPPGVQAKLLRVLQDRVIERVGGSEEIRVDVRVVAATNCDLEGAMRGGRFREDLFFRLNVFPVAIPPLRERKEDVPELARWFVARYGARLRKRFTSVEEASLQRLAAYPWPGNVRELENVIARAAILCDGPEFRIPPEPLPAAPRGTEAASTAGGTLSAAIRSHILAALRASRGRIYGPGGAAESLGVRPTTLQSKMKKLGIRRGGNAWV